MNDISFFFILLFGIIFGYVFPVLLEELGASKKVARSWIAVFSLALLSFLGFLLYPFVIFGYFGTAEIGSFYTQASGIFLYLAVSFLIGGAANLGYDLFREKK